LQHGIDRHNATPRLVSSLPAINDLCADAMKSWKKEQLFFVFDTSR
jgi:hypothetical protein